MELREGIYVEIKDKLATELFCNLCDQQGIRSCTGVRSARDLIREDVTFLAIRSSSCGLFICVHTGVLPKSINKTYKRFTL